jgi:hypothetical protein
MFWEFWCFDVMKGYWCFEECCVPVWAFAFVILSWCFERLTYGVIYYYYILYYYILYIHIYTYIIYYILYYTLTLLFPFLSSSPSLSFLPSIYLPMFSYLLPLLLFFLSLILLSPVSPIPSSFHSIRVDG